jgi:N-acetylglucosamine kinase-like BadF-type ATPase
MILIADSGSTKTDWTVLSHTQTVKQVKTKGLNPFFMTEEEITEEIKEALLPELPKGNFDSVFFYGAGCTPEKQPIVERALHNALTITGPCEVASDMLGAARAICGHKPGIACILGTGSNSCAYDGERITANVSPLGFILGDEGSGAVLGKTLVGDVLKHQLPQSIVDRFNEKYHLSTAEIIDRVYRQKLPNRFLASFVPFLEENLDEPSIYRLVKNAFTSFLVRNVEQYEGWERLPIGFVGSIAHFYRKPLEDALAEQDMRLGRIIQAPMEGLIAYHSL